MKLYYFSKPRLQYIEIKNFKLKLISWFFLSVLLFSSMIFGIYNFVYELTNPSKDINKLKNENLILQSKLLDVKSIYTELAKSLDSLVFLNKELRIAANLEPVSDEERIVGVGGGFYDNSIDYLSNNLNDDLQDLLSYVDEVQRKLLFEKNQFSDISGKLEENKSLYKSLPAIKPCSGSLAFHGFGMRLHPILNIKRMHEGIDIVTNVGTPVYTSGDGVVDFVGYDGGYGLSIEIDHGFGYRTLYAHLSKVNIKKGEKVKRGQLIAKTGNSGLSTGPHLHYEVSHNGIKQNPAQFFFDDLAFFK